MRTMNLMNRFSYHILLWVSILQVCLFTACGDDKPGNKTTVAIPVPVDAAFSTEDFAEALQQLFPPDNNIADTTGIIKPEQALALAYQQNGYQPVWIDDRQETLMATALITELDSLYLDGINPARYQLDALRKCQQKAIAPTATLGDAIAFDTLCSKMYLSASRDLLLGVANATRTDSQWHHSNDAQWQAYKTVAEIGKTKEYISLDLFRSKWEVYTFLREAGRHYRKLREDTAFCNLKNSVSLKTPDSVLAAMIEQELPWLGDSVTDSSKRTATLIKGFQYYFGQKVTGKLDSVSLRCLQQSPDTVLQHIAVNQERVRWMNQLPETTHIIVPLGLMELFLTRDGEEVMHMRTVIGKPGRSTPSLNAPMVNVVINPPWGVPPTILKNDVVPGLTKAGGAYLAKKGLKAYDRKGNLVQSSKVNSSNYKHYDYRQDPGARNALGVIKFNLPNKWDIYLHDTPHKEDFPNRNRAKSSGCVRLQRPLDLGVYILHDMEGNAKLNEEGIDSIVQTRRTRYYNLKNRIPVHIVYLTAYKDSSSNHLRLLDDIYKRDAAVANKL